MHLWWVWKDVIWKVRLSHRCQLRNLYLNSAPGCLTRRPFSKGKPFSKEWGLTLTQPTQPDTNLNSYGITKTRTWTLNYCHINYRRNGRVEHRRALGHTSWWHHRPFPENNTIDDFFATFAGRSFCPRRRLVDGVYRIGALPIASDRVRNWSELNIFTIRG